MKTLRRLVISPREITQTIKDEQDQMAKMASIKNVLTIVNDYRHVPDILNKLEIESDRDIDQRSIKRHVVEPGYHNIHLVLTYADWDKLGVRGNLLGQSREIDGQIITYGRWNQNMPYRSKVVRKHPHPIHHLSEAGLGAWHELDHGLRRIWNINPTSTHYHFYGYAAAEEKTTREQQNISRPRRYVRKPDVMEAWHALPWNQLVDLEETYKKDLLVDTLLKLIALLRKQLAAKVATKQKLVHPVAGYPVSQKYGAYNPYIYKLTKHHIGTDYAAPLNTPIKAPADGKATRTGVSTALGNWVEYKYADNRYLVALHLKSQPGKRTYKAGETIGYVGKTGYIEGIHSHIEVWLEPMNRGSLTEANFKKKTLDPVKVFT